MASKKKRGTARTGARPKSSRTQSRTTGSASTGKGKGGSKRPSKGTLHTKKPRAIIRIYKPFFSAAMGHWKLACQIPDKKVGGGLWGSAIYCERQEDSDALDRIIKGLEIKTRRDWTVRLGAAIKAYCDRFPHGGRIYRISTGDPVTSFRNRK